MENKKVMDYNNNVIISVPLGHHKTIDASYIWILKYIYELYFLMIKILIWKVELIWH